MMNERELGKALLKGEGAVDAEALTEAVLRRDRRRMWGLGVLCVLAWMMVVMLPWATILPMLAKVVKHQTDMSSNGAGAPATMGDSRTETLRVLQAVRIGTIATFLGSIGSMLVAA